MENKYFKFYSSCIPVIGAKRGIIYDLRRGDLYYLPKTILEILDEYSTFELHKLFEDYKSQINILKKYLNYLVNNELIFFTNNLENFPCLDKTFKKPFVLDILLLEIDNFDLTKKKLVESQEVNSLGFTEIVLISNTNSIENLEKILFLLDKTKVQTLSYFIDFKYFNFDKINLLSEKFLRLREVIVFNCPKGNDLEKRGNINFLTLSIDDFLLLKITNVNDFVVNINAYTESQKYNLFYNRRIYVDNKNNVKHGIKEIGNFGNLKISKIVEILSSNNFTNLWNISKDQIEVCKDCEFRYICPDNRIPIKKDAELYYYHNNDCNYNPYTNQWK